MCGCALQLVCQSSLWVDIWAGGRFACGNFFQTKCVRVCVCVVLCRRYGERLFSRLFIAVNRNMIRGWSALEQGCACHYSTAATSTASHCSLLQKPAVQRAHKNQHTHTHTGGSCIRSILASMWHVCGMCAAVLE